MQVLYNCDIETFFFATFLLFFFSLQCFVFRTSSFESFINKKRFYFLMISSSETDLANLLLILYILRSKLF